MLPWFLCRLLTILHHVHDAFNELTLMFLTLLFHLPLCHDALLIADLQSQLHDALLLHASLLAPYMKFLGGTFIGIIPTATGP